MSDPFERFLDSYWPVIIAAVLCVGILVAGVMVRLS